MCYDGTLSGYRGQNVAHVHIYVMQFKAKKMLCGLYHVQKCRAVSRTYSKYKLRNLGACECRIGHRKILSSLNNKRSLARSTIVST